MKITRTAVQLCLGALVYSSLVGCKDFDKLLSGLEKKNAEPPVVQPIPVSTTTVKKAGIQLPATCAFPNASAQKNIDVYAIDGQAWIEAADRSNDEKAGIATITVNIDAPEVSALLLTAREPALWRIKPSKRTKLWGVYVSAEATQLVAGVSKPTLLEQHYAELSDKCGFYWRPDLQVHELYDFSKQLFGKPYIALPKIIAGVAEIKSFEPLQAEANANKLSSQASLPNNPPPVQAAPPAKPMTLTEALRANVIRPGSAGDLERFKSRYLAVNQRALGKSFDEHTQWMPVYVITGDFTFGGNLAGAHSVVFILENRAPYPSGDSEHSPVLDMNSGACMGNICSMIIGDQ